MKKNKNKNRIKNKLNEARVNIHTDNGLEEVSIRFPYPVYVYNTNIQGVLIQIIVDMMSHIKSLEDRIKTLNKERS